MQLAHKKDLVARVLKVGRNRVVFHREGLAEIKEAITRQDIRDLVSSGAISVHEVKGRKKIVKRRHRRRAGKIKNPVKDTKREYMTMTRKLRVFAKHLKRTNAIDDEKYKTVRNMIRARKFKSKRHLKEGVGEL